MMQLITIPAMAAALRPGTSWLAAGREELVGLFVLIAVGSGCDGDENDAVFRLADAVVSVEVVVISIVGVAGVALGISAVVEKIAILVRTPVRVATGTFAAGASAVAS